MKKTLMFSSAPSSFKNYTDPTNMGLMILQSFSRFFDLRDEFAKGNVALIFKARSTVQICSSPKHGSLKNIAEIVDEITVNRGD